MAAALRWVGLAAVLAVGLRIPYLTHPLSPDEGGYLLVARQWDGAGPHLYGELWVDRPPLLLAFYRLADALGGVLALRLLTCVAVVALVAVAGWVGWQLAGSRGAAWAAFAVAGLSASRMIAAQAADTELLAAPLVLLCCALVLAAVRQPELTIRALAMAVAAGAAGASAALLKQNIMDGLVFGAVLVVAYGITRRIPPGDVGRLLAAGAVGAAAVAALLVGWAQWFSPGVDVLWAELYGFRNDALVVILDQNLDPPLQRLALLLELSVFAGVIPLLVLYFSVGRRGGDSRDSGPVLAATAALAVYAVIGMALGLSFWSQYLLGLLPAVAIASAALAGDELAGRWARLRPAVVGLVAISGAVAAVAGALVYAGTGYPFGPTEELVAWLHSSAREGDQVVVTYGGPHLIAESGLEPAYPYLWSLGVRTLDPDGERLEQTLSRPDAPRGWWSGTTSGRGRWTTPGISRTPSTGATTRSPRSATSRSTCARAPCGPCPRPEPAATADVQDVMTNEGHSARFL